MNEPTTIHGSINLSLALDMNLETACPDCDGTGYLEHFAWQEFREQYEPAEEQDYGRPECEDCGLDATWCSRREITYACDTHAGMPAEDEMVGCGDCDGTGVVPTDAGRAILAFLRRHKP